MRDPLSRRGVLIGAGLCALAPLVAGRAAAQALPVLPQTNDGTWSSNPAWTILRQTHLKVDSNGVIRAAFTPHVLALAGKPLAISGFVMPIDADARHHFILSRYSPECPFCPAGGPTETIEVFADQPFGKTPLMVTVKGQFAVQGDMEAGLFYSLRHAVPA